MTLLNWSNFFKSYDVRGLVESELTEPVVRAIGAAFADFLDLDGKSLAVGHDMRVSSPSLAAAFAEGANLRGANVQLLGLCSTDMTYFASGSLALPAAMFTASHNPASYNGIKLSRAGAQGISLSSGLGEVRDRAEHYFETEIPSVSLAGETTRVDLLRQYAEYLRSLVPIQPRRNLRIVVDAANGMAGFTVPAVFGEAAGLPQLSVEIIPLYFELDGTFPNHEANPLEPKNLVDLQGAVLLHGADLGLAFDGDADRCFAVDELGNPVSPSAIGSLVAAREISRVSAKGETHPNVLHNLLSSRSVAEGIIRGGGQPIRTRVGHSLIKDEMARTNAVFGTEHSAHYYFREFWGADNGMLAALHLVAELLEVDKPMSQLARELTPYFQSGEINFRVSDVSRAQRAVVAALPRSSVDELDGVTLSGGDELNDWWWVNVRPSNTEPLLRLNVEAARRETMEEIRDRAAAALERSRV